MAPFVFDYAKGRVIEKFLLPLAPADSINVLLLQSSGLQADATLNNYQTVAAMLVNNTEAAFTNYARKSNNALNITVTVNTSTGVVTADLPDQVWNAAGGATNNTLGALITYYSPSSGAGDGACLPLTNHVYSTSTTGGNLTAAIPSVCSAQ